MKAYCYLSMIFMVLMRGGLALAATDYRTEFTRKMNALVRHWNQAESYQVFVQKSPFSKADKKQLSAFLKKEGLLSRSPAKLEFQAEANQFIIRTDETTDSRIWIIEIAPELLVYDGEKIFEFSSKSKMKDILVLPDEVSSQPPKTSLLLNLWQQMVPEAQAQFLTIEQQLALERRYKKAADRQTRLVKTILIAGVVGFGVPLVGGYLWGKFAHHLNPTWGHAGREKVRRDKVEAKKGFPDIEKTLFETEEPLVHFECEEGGQSSPARMVRFKGKQGNFIEFDLKGDVKKRQTLLAQQDESGRKINKIEECCQHYPCSQWLAQRLTGSTPDIYKSPGAAREGENK